MKNHISNSCVSCDLIGGDCCGVLYCTDSGKFSCNKCGRFFNINLVGENELAQTTLKKLRHYKDTTIGLWCIDRNPNEVDIEWIQENSFQLTDPTNV